MAKSSLNLAVIEKESVSEQVVTQLLAAIRAGKVKAEDRLPSERDLAISFGVSRPTIREAVRALVVLGVLKTRHGGGIFVSSLKAEDLLSPLQYFLSIQETSVDQLYDARELIEGGIAFRAAANASLEDVEHLNDIIQLQKLAINDPFKYRILDNEFHQYIHGLAKNSFLSRAANSLNILGQEFRKVASESSDIILQSIFDHMTIVKALKNKNSEQAENAMRCHMLNVLKSTKNSMEILTKKNKGKKNLK